MSKMNKLIDFMEESVNAQYSRIAGIYHGHEVYNKSEIAEIVATVHAVNQFICEDLLNFVAEIDSDGALGIDCLLEVERQGAKDLGDIIMKDLDRYSLSG